MERKDTTLICETGESTQVFHSSEAARERYENNETNHDVVTLDLKEEFERMTSTK